MIRIITADEQGRTTITVDGVLAGESLDLIEKCCAEALSEGQPVRLHLREVSGIYSSYLVDEIQADRRRSGAH
jgi:hypothetical protein